MMEKHDWSCGHVAGSVCAECYQALARRANKLAEQVFESQRAAARSRPTARRDRAGEQMTDDEERRIIEFVRRGKVAQQAVDDALDVHAVGRYMRLANAGAVIRLKEKIAIGAPLSPDEITFVLSCINIATRSSG